MRFQCPECKGIVSVDDADMGSTVQCGHCGKPVSVPSSRTAPGSVIGDFIIMHEIGRGGMGIVYLAHQISLDRPAALKILSSAYAKNADFVVGFIKEARAAAKLNHPNIVQAYAVGDDDGIFYFAMEHVNGETMKNILKREKVIPVDQAISIVQQIAEALDYAWEEEKLVHRDIKPDNIMLTSNGRAKLADLGLAKVGDDTGINDGDEVMGTPQYISPEQLTGDPLDNRTDIYSLGATFYHLLTGRFPYEGANAIEITRQHLYGTLIPPNRINPDVPEDVALVVEKMMAKDPAQRYQSAAQLAEDLALIRHGQHPAMATVTGSLRVQHSNQEEAAHTPLPSKLRIHEEQNYSGTETVPENPSFAEAAAKAAPKAPPKLSIAKPKMPSKPEATAAAAPAAEQPAKTPLKPGAPSLKMPAQEKKTEAPKEAAPNPDTAALLAAAEAAAKKAMAQKGKKKKQKDGSGGRLGKTVVLVIAGLVILAVLGAGGFAAYMHFVKKTEWSAIVDKAKTGIQQVTESAKPEISEFRKAASPVLKTIQTRGETDPADTARQCRLFLKKYPAPETAEDQELLAQIVQYFAAHDEEQVENARLTAIQKYEDEQRRKQIAAEEAERRRKEEAERKREADANRQLAQAEQARKQQEITNFRNRMTALERQMVLELQRKADQHDEAGLRKIFETNAAAMTTAPDHLKQYARTLVNRANALQKIMEGAWEWDHIFTSGDPALTGLNIEIKHNICKLESIKDGVIHARNITGKEYTEEVRKIVSTRAFRVFAVNAGIKLNKLDTLPYYFFWMGQGKTAWQVSQDTTSAQQAAYSRFVTEYLRAALVQASDKAAAARKFGDVPEYQRLVPKRRR